MKQFVYKILLLLLAISVFTTGMGANIVKYCCTDCQSNTILFSKHDCEAVHHQQSTPGKKHDTCCVSMDNGVHQDNDVAKTCSHEVHSGDDAHCSISRVSIDLDSYQFKPQLSSPMVWVSDLAFLLTSVIPFEAECSNHCEHLLDPLVSPPREYLSLIRVLII